MEKISKKEFCEKYADKKDKDNIKGAASLAYVCAAISLGLGVFMHNYGVVVDVALIVGLGLGVQIAKSRVCAVLLLIYSGINTVVSTIALGRVSGWWLILVGIWAVKGTFNLHKDYQRFLRDGTIPQNIESEARPQPKATVGQLIATLLPFVAMFLGLLLVWVSISTPFLEMLVGGAQSPEELLQGYGNWYIAIMGAIVAAVLLTAAGGVVSIKKGFRRRMSVILTVICLMLPILLGGLLIAGENIPGLLSQAKADLAQIESDQLREVTVWLSPKSHPAGLSGPYAEGQPEPVTDYGGISDDTDGMWVHFYVPDCLGFSLDQNALFNENESINWNEEHARKYLIRYTENFRLAVSVEPVDNVSEELSQPEWETQVYEDEYLSYEIPADWIKNEANSSDELRLTLFTVKEPATAMPSNVSVQILNLQSQSKDFDYSDPTIQELYHQFLISPDSGLVDEAREGEYAVEQIGETWVYSLSFAREASDGTMVQQTGYFPMGLDYSMVIWATDYKDGCTPAVEEIAKHICETLNIIGN